MFEQQFPGSAPMPQFGAIRKYLAARSVGTGEHLLMAGKAARKAAKDAQSRS
jgi:hypothetical protein